MSVSTARRCLVICAVLCSGSLIGSALQAVAFLGAEGQGASSVGGRGGVVLFVTSLADSGPGTLRAALERSGPRTVIFRIGGTITLQSPLVITNPYVTVAGQTAPGGGIQLRNDPVAPYGLATDSFTSLVIRTHDVVIRYLRIRPGPLQPNPSCTGRNAVRHPAGLETCYDADDIQSIALEAGARRVMLDHLSLAFGNDELLDMKGAQEVTLQWSILGEGLNFALYEGNFTRASTDYGHGVLIGSIGGAKTGEVNGRFAFHHNLFSVMPDRMPQLTLNCPSASRPLDCASDIVNNYIYGWQRSGVTVANFLGHTYVNLVGNYIRGSRDTVSLQRGLNLNDWGRADTVVVPDARLGAYTSGNAQQTADGATSPAPSVCVRWNQTTRRWENRTEADYRFPRYATPPIQTTDAVTARNKVLQLAGASLRLDQNGALVPARDTADTRVVTDASRGTGRIISSLAEFPGWPTLANATPPSDMDRDGMPDRWEDLYCLDATRSDHQLDADRDGWTNLEEYLNGTAPCGTSATTQQTPTQSPGGFRIF